MVVLDDMFCRSTMQPIALGWQARITVVKRSAASAQRAAP
jgi:hypothetical protein